MSRCAARRQEDDEGWCTVKDDRERKRKGKNQGGLQGCGRCSFISLNTQICCGRPTYPSFPTRWHPPHGIDMSAAAFLRLSGALQHGLELACGRIGDTCAKLRTRPSMRFNPCHVPMKIDHHNHTCKRTALEELEENVAAPDELARDVALGDGRPVGELLDLLAHQRVAQNVERLELRVHGPDGVSLVG